MYFMLTSVIIGLTTGLSLTRTEYHNHEQTGRPCEQGATNLGKLLDSYEEEIPADFPFTLHTILSDLMSRNLSYQENREDIICTLRGLSTLSELQEAAYRLRLEYRLLLAAYAEFQLVMIRIKNYPDNTLTTQPQIISYLEEFGLMSLDPYGYEHYIEPLLIYDDHEIGPKMPPSSLPPEMQCEILTDELLKLWMSLSNIMTSNDFEDMNVRMLNWTGIGMTDREAFRVVVCELMGAANEDRLMGIRSFLQNTGVYTRLLKWGYPELVNGAKWLQEELPKPQTKRDLIAEALRSKKSNHGGRRGRSDDSGTNEPLTHVARLLANLEDMGLYTLRDDLSV